MSSVMFDPSCICPFPTYRQYDAAGNYIETDVAPSLLHHYESEKFRGVDESMRLHALEAPSVKQLRKFTRKNQKKWRSDWRLVRGNVLRAGMAMQAAHSQTAKRNLIEAFHQSIEISGIKSLAGLPGPFVSTEIQRFMQSRREGGRTLERLGVIALNGCVPDDIFDRLSAMYANALPFSALIYSGLDGDPAVELWCAQNAVPIRRVCSELRRFREKEAAILIKDTTTLVTCMPESRTSCQAILKMANKRRPRLRILEFQATVALP